RAMAYYRNEIVAGQTCVEFIYQVLGRGTQALAAMEPGAQVDFLGSLGNTYDLDMARGREALLVAGGTGSAALFMLAEQLVSHGGQVKLFLGGASEADLCGLSDFSALLGAGQVICATADGSYGAKGFVSAPLETYLTGRGGAGLALYACGPDPMLHRISQIAEEHGVAAQLSLEAPMACGYGVCVGCAVPVKADVPEGFVYKKVCTDGPVFAGHQLHWQ
ncbi:MAG: dihydroorotate dehydrogenase electron transfer subunit, partial [Blastocatellia bacterium]